MSVLELNGRVFDASTTGTLTLTGEGSATTDVTQGLAKSWGVFDGTATAYQDSFNCSNFTDNGTSDYSSTRTNNMASPNHPIIGAAGLNTTSMRAFVIPENLFTPTAATFRMQVVSADGTLGNTEAEFVAFDVKGDLA